MTNDHPTIPTYPAPSPAGLRCLTRLVDEAERRLALLNHNLETLEQVSQLCDRIEESLNRWLELGVMHPIPEHLIEASAVICRMMAVRQTIITLLRDPDFDPSAPPPSNDPPPAPTFEPPPKPAPPPAPHNPAPDSPNPAAYDDDITPRPKNIFDDDDDFDDIDEEELSRYEPLKPMGSYSDVEPLYEVPGVPRGTVWTAEQFRAWVLEEPLPEIPFIPLAELVPFMHKTCALAQALCNKFPHPLSIQSAIDHDKKYPEIKINWRVKPRPYKHYTPAPYPDELHTAASDADQSSAEITNIRNSEAVQNLSGVQILSDIQNLETRPNPPP